MPSMRTNSLKFASKSSRLFLRWGLVTTACLLATSVPAEETSQPPDSPFSEAEYAHWAFQPVHRPAVPSVGKANLVQTPIDAFILNRLEPRGLTFSPPADRRTLIRRAKLDLLGLPPSPAEIDEFLHDRRSDAYERLIDAYLASPQYGETWGRDWLDLVRFAETAGFNADPARPLSYKFRDYVIRAFNNDTPYDRFAAEQLAGDELFPESVEALIATGFNRMWPDESNASNVLLARQDALNDLTANFGSVFLGLSVGCAQCHDHKFDPILQTDFYQLQSFFAGIVLEDRLPVATNEELIAYRRRLQQWLEKTAVVRDELHRIESTARAEAGRIKRLKFPAVVLAAIDTPREKRTAYQHQLVFWSDRQILVNEKQLLSKMTDEQKNRRPELKKQLEKLLASKPRPSVETHVMATVEVDNLPPATHLLAGGSYDKPLAELQPGFPAILSARNNVEVQIISPRPGTSGRRTALTRWLTSPDNPLTPRVMVNRIWQGHLGRGLVATGNDFGTQAVPPSHPELLDWLAAEFIARDWSIKQMHRLIMTSNVYRQATAQRSFPQWPFPAARIDPENRLYWHFARRRLTAERIRDSLLQVAGKINTGMYGPGVRPPLPANFNSREKWDVSKNALEANRRSVYIYAKRNLPYPLLQSFDLPDMHESCAQRAETTIAPQALTLLNSQLVLDAARSLAVELYSGAGSGELPPLIERAYRVAFGRLPDTDEINAAVAFIRQQRSLVSDDQVKEHQNRQSTLLPATLDAKSLVAFIDFCHTLLNANEFLYVE